MEVDIHSGDDSGTAVTVNLTAAESAPLGADIRAVANWSAAVLAALVLLRTGHVGGTPTASDLYPPLAEARTAALEDVGALHRSVRGLLDALIRSHDADGGSHGDLARALRIRRSSAQTWRNALRTKPPTPAEIWATGDSGIWRTDMNGGDAPGPAVSVAAVERFRSTLVNLIRRAGRAGISAIDLDRALVASGVSEGIPMPTAVQVLDGLIADGRIRDDGTRYFYGVRDGG